MTEPTRAQLRIRIVEVVKDWGDAPERVSRLADEEVPELVDLVLDEVARAKIIPGLPSRRPDVFR